SNGCGNFALYSVRVVQSLFQRPAWLYESKQGTGYTGFRL
ncbi:MAG: hypothetical protein AVDCRST_MAG95-2380, partial [uncultured Adhaeribacter sp.]